MHINTPYARLCRDIVLILHNYTHDDQWLLSPSYPIIMMNVTKSLKFGHGKDTAVKDRLTKLIKNLFHYGIVGGIAALAEWSSFYIFNEVMGINHMLSTCFSFFIGTATNFLLASKFVFKTSKFNKAGELSLVYLVSVVGLLFNLGLMKLFVDVMGLKPPLLSKIIATGIVFLWNFLSRRYLIYREEKKQEANAILAAEGNGLQVGPTLGSNALYHVAPLEKKDLQKVQAFIAEKMRWEIDLTSITFERCQPPYNFFIIEYNSGKYRVKLADESADKQGSREGQAVLPTEPSPAGDPLYYDRNTGNTVECV
jgi:putative flippase GtrA